MNERLYDLLPNPFAVDYQHGDAPLDLYTEPEMERFAARVINECIKEIRIACEDFATGENKNRNLCPIGVGDHLAKILLKRFLDQDPPT